MERLDVKGLALGTGTAWGLCVLLAGWAAAFGWCDTFVAVMGSVYIGYGPTWIGGIVGGAWGFLDGAVGGAVIAFVYNKTAGRG